MTGKFSLDYKYFFNLTNDDKEKILDYELMIYFCEGSDKDKLEWFKVINIAGEKLTEQELRNAIYTGPWLTEAKKYFSKTNCPAYSLGSNYVKGSPIRQELLEKVLTWISNDNIEEYMAIHQHETNATELWLFFNSIINWVKTIFPNYRREMKGVEWGNLYLNHHSDKLDPIALENEIATLMKDEDVTKKSGIYVYLLTKEEKHLNIRVFSDNQKREAYERQKGICPIRKKYYSIEDMEADHIKPWSQGGKTTSENCQMIEKQANREKSDK